MNIIVAEDRKRVRMALHILLEQQTGWIVVGEASNAAELLVQTAQSRPDMVLVDESLPGLNENHIIDTVREICPDVRIVALINPHSVGSSDYHFGADAYATKVNSPDYLLSAIRNCLQRRI